MYDECPRHYAAGMWWERTDYGDTAIQPCPIGSVGMYTITEIGYSVNLFFLYFKERCFFLRTISLEDIN